MPLTFASATEVHHALEDWGVIGVAPTTYTYGAQYREEFDQDFILADLILSNQDLMATSPGGTSTPLSPITLAQLPAGPSQLAVYTSQPYPHELRAYNLLGTDGGGNMPQYPQALEEFEDFEELEELEALEPER